MTRSPILKVVNAKEALQDPFKGFELSDTQHFIATLAAKGNTVIEIMRETALARSTVAQHLGQVKERTKCEDYPDGMSRLDLVKYLVSQIEEALE